MDQVWAVTMVRDEADVIAGALAHLVSEGLDGIIVADNNSVDGTREILEEFSKKASIPVLVQSDPEVAYEQSRKMTNLAHQAKDLGASWILPVDADELWYSSHGLLADFLRTQDPDVRYVEALLFNHFRTAHDPGTEDVFASMQYRQSEAAPLPKVAIRYRRDMTIAMGNHGVTFRDQPAIESSQINRAGCGLEVRHFPYRSAQQFIRKVRNGGQAYAATTFDESVGAHWRQYNALIETLGEETFIRDVWERYYYFESPDGGGLIHDPAPYLRWAS